MGNDQESRVANVEGLSDEEKQIFYASLREACIHGSEVSAVVCINSQFSNYRNLIEEANFDPLHLSVDLGHSTMVAFLGGILDVNFYSEKYGGTPMFLAAKHGNLEIVEILQTHGASSDQRVTETNSPLYQALINGHSHVAKVLINKTGSSGMESAIVTLSCYSGLLELMETYWTEEMKVDGQFCEAFQPKLFSKLGGTVEQFNLCKFKQFLLLLTFQQLQKGTSAKDTHWNIVRFLLGNGTKIDQVIVEEFSDQLLDYLNLGDMTAEPRCNWSSKGLEYLDYPRLLSPMQDCLQELNLSKNCLTQLPSEIPWRLQSLERLIINSCPSLKSIPDPTEGIFCFKLTKVSISGNACLRDIPEAIFHLAQLRELDLSGNRIKHICKKPAVDKCSCSSLESLNLATNRLKTIHPTFFSGAISLKTLYIQENHLQTLPEPWKCPLVKLVAKHNQLTTLPEGMDIWRHSLQYLDVSHNKLTEVPLGLCVIKSLVELNLSHNKLEELPPPEQWRCSKLHTLNLCHNLLGSSQQQPKTRNLSSGIKMYTDDNILAAKELALSTVFAEKLSSLDLSFNNLQRAPLGLCELYGLSELNLSGNPNMTELPNELAKLQCLDILNVSDLDLTSFPPALNPRRSANKVRTTDIIGYLRSSFRKEENYRFLKIIVVGYEGSGTTSLIRNLFGGGKPAEEANVPLITYHHRLTSNSHSLPRSLGVSKGRKSVHLTIWELASPTKYHAVHQCFMTDGALYMVVVRIDSADWLQTVSRWLLTIRARGPNSSVLIVGTHSESLATLQDPSFEAKRIKQEVLHFQYKISDCPRLEDFIMISNDTGQNMSLLKEALYKISLSLVRSVTVPRSYAMIHMAIEKEKGRRKANKLPPWLSEADLWSLFADVPDCDIQQGDQEELLIMTKIFHQAGVFLHYADNMRTLDTKYYYLDPMWLSERLARVIADQGTKRKLTHENVNKLLEDSKLLDVDMTHLSELMQRFELILALNQNRWLIPCRLAKESPEIELELNGPLLCRMYRMGFTPPGFWSRLLVRLLMRLRQCVPQIHQRQKVSQAKESKQPDLLRRSTMMRQRSIVKPSSTDHMWQTFYWSEGLVIQHTDGYLRVESLRQSPVSEFFSGESQYSDGVCVIAYSKSKLSGLDYSYFSLAIDEVDLLISEWFPEVDYGQERIRRYVMCPTCLQEVWEEPADETATKARGVGCFPLESVASCAQKSNRIVCPIHEDTPVPMENVIPDLLLHDVPCLNLINPAKLQLKEFIARGGQASIHRGIFRNQNVALKVFYFFETEPSTEFASELPSSFLTVGSFAKEKRKRVTSLSVRDELDLSLLFAFQRMRKEVMFLTALNHPNIISIVGVVNQPGAPLLGFSLEYAPYGSLYSYLTKTKSSQNTGNNELDLQYGCILDRFLTYKIAWQIVAALGYLHQQGIIYRDLKSDNVLVMSKDATEQVNVKLSDYGISSYLNAQGMFGTEGTPGFQAPEILKNMVYNEKVDIFSFGMVLFELMSGLTPFPDLQFLEDIRRAVKRGKRPCLQEAHVHAGFIGLERLMERCWQNSPAARPAASLIRELMEDVFFYSLKAEITLKCAEDSFKDDLSRLDRADQISEEGDQTNLVIHSYISETNSELLWAISGDNEQRVISSIDAGRCVSEYQAIPYPGHRLLDIKSADEYMFAVTGSATEPIEVFTYDPSAKLPVHFSVIENQIDMRSSDIKFICLETLLHQDGEVVLAIGTNSSQVYLFKWNRRNPKKWSFIKILQLNSYFLPVRHLMTVSKYATVVATCGSVMYFISGETFLVEETVTNYDCGTILQLCQTEDHLLVSFEDLPLVRGFRLKHPYDLLLCLNLSDLNLEIGHCLTVESPETFDVHKLKVRGRSSSSNFIHYDLKKRRSSSINSNCYEPTTFGKGPIVVDFMAVHKDVLWLARSDGLMLLIGMGSNDAVGELLAQYRIVQLTTDNAMVESIVSLDSHVAVLLTKTLLPTKEEMTSPTSPTLSFNLTTYSSNSIMMFKSITVADIDGLRKIWRKLRKAENAC